MKNTDHMTCRYCGRIKRFYTRRGTSTSHFGDGCKKNPKGSWHFYQEPEPEKAYHALETWTQKDLPE